MFIFAELVQADKRVMSVENYLIYTCAWCCLQDTHPQDNVVLHDTEFAIACRGGIVFW